MDLRYIGLMILTWLYCIGWFQNLCSSAMYVAQFLSSCFNALGQLRMVLLAGVLDELPDGPVRLTIGRMDYIGLMILTWLYYNGSFQNLCSSALYVAQFLLVQFHLSSYFNALRQLRVVLLAGVLDELLEESSIEAMLSNDASSSGSLQGQALSRVQALLEIRAEFDSLQKLLQAFGPNPVWSIVYGSQMDTLLLRFEAILAPATTND